MTDVGWLCLDGTNSWGTNTTLGANLIIRQPLLQRFLDIGANVYFFGLREESNVIEGKTYDNLVPIGQLKQNINQLLRDYDKQWKADPKEGSMSKWVVGHAISDALDSLAKDPLPKIDFLFAEYMDNGAAQIAYFSVILIHYAQRNVPIYVRDTERRFRYNSEIRELFDETRETMYSHRLGRYVDEEHLAELNGQIRMVYPFKAEWDDGTDGFYRTPPIYMPIIYDPERELPLVKLKEKKHPVVYIGNDNNRREMLEMWYGSLCHEAFVFGNWRKRRGGEEYVESWKQRNPRIRFADPVPMSVMLPALQRGWTSVVVYPKHYVTLGQLTDRMAELPLAGTIPIAPSELWNAKEWTLKDFIVTSPADMNVSIENIMGFTQRDYDDAVHAVRELLKKNFDADQVFNDLCVALMKDGVKIKELM